MSQWGNDLLTVAVLIAFGLLVSKRSSIWHALRFPGFRNWPVYPATVQSRNYKEINSRRGTAYFAEIAYSYRIDGEYYSGYHKADLFSEDQLNSFFDSFPIDSTINVHVNPRKPSESVFTGES